MKIRKPGALLGLLLTAYVYTAAQNTPPPVNQPDYNKPKIFTDLPNRQVLRLAEAEALLNLPVGATANAVIADGWRLAGTVVSKSNAADLSSQSVVIKVPARSNATFTFTRIKNADGTVLYRGRLLSRSAGDALEIVKENAAYIIRKTGYYDLISE